MNFIETILKDHFSKTKYNTRFLESKGDQNRFDLLWFSKNTTNIFLEINNFKKTLMLIVYKTVLKYKKQIKLKWGGGRKIKKTLKLHKR